MKNENNNDELAGQLISYLKSEFVWFETRWNECDIEHKQLISKMLNQSPDIGYHLSVMMRRNIGQDVWSVSSQELDLLVLLALPYDDDEYVLTDDTGIIGLDGKKILRGQ
jgi:hypothetical protein